MSGADPSCVVWRKSSRSSSNGGQCVEVASIDHVVAVRDSKNPDGPKLMLTRAQWGAFIGNASEGTFDL
jgi:xanthine/CO dehydrogenase XdhC/CoxF family maturation factor